MGLLSLGRDSCSISTGLSGSEVSCHRSLPSGTEETLRGEGGRGRAGKPLAFLEKTPR